jgi:hypothetical protein
MHSAFLWLSFAIGFAGDRGCGARAQARDAPLERVRGMLTPPAARYIARRSGWTRAMEELALVPVRPPGHRGAPMR